MSRHRGLGCLGLPLSHQDPMNVDYEHMYEDMEPGLLPGLPNDLALQCLVRVPRKFHSKLANVCKQWKELLLSREYYILRKALSVTEGWIYALCRDSSEVSHWYALDPMERKWRKLPPMPGDRAIYFGMSSAVMHDQLFVLGGGKKFQTPTSGVIKYDPVTNKWHVMANMKTARWYFISAAFDGRLYAIGGMGTIVGILSSWEVYDPVGNRWLSFKDANMVPDSEDPNIVPESLMFDSSFYIRHSGPLNFPPAHAAMYNPTQNSWVPVDNEMTKNWCGPTAVSGNDVYMLDQTFGLQLMLLEKQTLTWKSLGPLAQICIQPPCKITAVGQNLYVVGKGLCGISVLNVVNGGDTELLITSSFKGPESSDSLTLSCHVIEL